MKKCISLLLTLGLTVSLLACGSADEGSVVTDNSTTSSVETNTEEAAEKNSDTSVQLPDWATFTDDDALDTNTNLTEKLGVDNLEGVDVVRITYETGVPQYFPVSEAYSDGYNYFAKYLTSNGECKNYTCYEILFDTPDTDSIIDKSEFIQLDNAENVERLQPVIDAFQLKQITDCYNCFVTDEMLGEISSNNYDFDGFWLYYSQWAASMDGTHKSTSCNAFVNTFDNYYIILVVDAKKMQGNILYICKYTE